MLFFRKRKPTPKKGFYPDDNKVHLHWGAYDVKANMSEEHYAFLVIPGEEIDSEEFRELALNCAEKMLSLSRVVLNNLYCYPLEPVEGTLSEDACVKRYVEQGGNPVFAAKNELYAVSKGIDRLLVGCVPEDAYGYYGLSFYGYDLIDGAAFHRNLTIHYHEDHQYLEVSALDDVSKCIDIVLEVCKKYGKQVVLPKE